MGSLLYVDIKNYLKCFKSVCNSFLALLDEDIKNDGECALKIFVQEGFKYWPKWEARCKGQLLPDIEKLV